LNLKSIENDCCTRINLCQNQQSEKETEEENQSCSRALMTANMNKADIKSTAQPPSSTSSLFFKIKREKQ